MASHLPAGGLAKTMSSAGSSPAGTRKRTPDPHEARAVNVVSPVALGAASLDLPTPKANSRTPDKTAEPQTDRPPSRARRRAKKALRVSCRCLGLGFMFCVFGLSLVGEPKELFIDKVSRRRIMSGLFAASLLIVALEDVIALNKSAVVLCLAATMWSVLAVSLHSIHPTTGEKILHEDLDDGLQEVGKVVLFLLPAMGVVESIDHFSGFEVVTRAIRSYVSRRKNSLLPISCVVSFVLSSVIDNLTSTIVMLKIFRHLVPDTEQRHTCGALVVLAANAGGAWSPIGDVTTTMLWINKKITVTNMVFSLFPPSVVAGIVPLLGMMFQARGSIRDMNCLAARKGEDAEAAPVGKAVPETQALQDIGELDFGDDDSDTDQEGTALRRFGPLVLGTAVIVMVPLLKMLTGLPPYLGMLFALGIFWLITDLAEMAPRTDDGWAPHLKEAVSEKSEDGAPTEGVVGALKGLDLTGLLFFIGILLSIGALNSATVLESYSQYMVDSLPNSPILLSIALGISSAVVDNVPLVQAAIDMFDDETDAPLWHLIALTAGTGGSILSIGSIAGVTLMSMEGVGFMWYMKKVSFWALLGFFAGVGTFALPRLIFG